MAKVETRIIALSGKKQSGKNTCCNFLHGSVLMDTGVINAFDFNEDGKLLVPAKVEDEIQVGLLDLDNNSPKFVAWLEENVWPFIKQFSFADLLKRHVCMYVLGLSHEQCFGTDPQKDTVTHLKWEDMPVPPAIFNNNAALKEHKKKRGYMTGREVMQYFGTEVFRAVYPNVWADSCIRRIVRQNPSWAVITDCRFPNEVEAVQNAGGKVIRLTRDPADGADTHFSERALDQENFDWSRFDAVLDNKNMNIHQQNVEIAALIQKWWPDAAEK